MFYHLHHFHPRLHYMDYFNCFLYFSLMPYSLTSKEKSEQFLIKHKLGPITMLFNPSHVFQFTIRKWGQKPPPNPRHYVIHAFPSDLTTLHWANDCINVLSQFLFKLLHCSPFCLEHSHPNSYLTFCKSLKPPLNVTSLETFSLKALSANSFSLNN